MYVVCKSLITLPPFVRVTASTEASSRRRRSCQAQDGLIVTNKAWCAKRQDGEILAVDHLCDGSCNSCGACCSDNRMAMTLMRPRDIRPRPRSNSVPRLTANIVACPPPSPPVDKVIFLGICLHLPAGYLKNLTFNKFSGEVWGVTEERINYILTLYRRNEWITTNI